jgi:hypothetical protein
VRPNFRQRRIVAFTAACCYAKSTPVAPQSSERAGRGAEAFVGKLEIRLQQGSTDGRRTGGAPAAVASA